jgi:arginyl-tRNA synthetase
MVELPEGKMKSREGTVVDADDLIESMYQEAKATSEESGKLADISEEEKDRLYRMIGLGALKYFILKVDPKKKMLFNPKESIDFNGNTGPFIQYTHARIRSILRKAGRSSGSDKGAGCGSLSAEAAASGSPELSAKEIRIVQLLNLYRQKLAEAAASFSPAVMAAYAYDLAKEFNQYYHDTQILRESDESVRAMRLNLISTVSEVLAATMDLLGIKLPERM